MLKKMKLVLAASVLMIGAGAGFAIAKNVDHGDRGHMKEKFDTNKDGKLDDAERAQMKEERAKHRAATVAKFDSNNDGKLDDTERNAMQAEHAKARFDKLDSNGDGVLSRDEFAKGKPGGFRHGMKRH
ncbi:MAG: hypothetical protein ABI867_40250 [Kofleriaceae bacterium]